MKKKLKLGVLSIQSLIVCGLLSPELSYGWTIISTPNWDVGSSVRHNLNVVGDVASLGQAGRDRDEQKAKEERERARIQAENAKRIRDLQVANVRKSVDDTKQKITEKEIKIIKFQSGRKSSEELTKSIVTINNHIEEVIAATKKADKARKKNRMLAEKLDEIILNLQKASIKNSSVENEEKTFAQQFSYSYQEFKNRFNTYNLSEEAFLGVIVGLASGTSVGLEQRLRQNLSIIYQDNNKVLAAWSDLENIEKAELAVLKTTLTADEAALKNLTN